MRIAILVELGAFWVAWLYPFLFRAPHKQKRESITLAGPTRIGLLLETGAIIIAYIFQRPAGDEPGVAAILLSTAIAALAVVIAWKSVAHLGRQFRVNAGLYHDHELVRSGPYAVVRHPIYSALLAMLVSTVLVVTRWQWAIVSLNLFIAGTEIRVHTEDGLLASRFGPQFEDYRRKVSAYIPGIR